MSSGLTILMISGSLRKGSVNQAVLRTAQELTPSGVAAELYNGVAELPHFNPDDDFEPLPPAVLDLRARIKSADAVLFSTPEYAGALPGSFKNLLEWTVGGGEGEIYGKPVAWINPSASITGAGDAYASLRIVLGYIGADIVEDACAAIPVPRQAIDGDGLVRDSALRKRISRVLLALVSRLRSGLDELAV